jgi:hypothetical protein
MSGWRPGQNPCWRWADTVTQERAGCSGHRRTAPLQHTPQNLKLQNIFIGTSPSEVWGISFLYSRRTIKRAHVKTS